MKAAYLELANASFIQYQGTAYYSYEEGVWEQAHPFLTSRMFTNGWLQYRGKLLKDVPLKYDLVKDLVVTHVNGGTPIGLQKEWLTAFGIHGSTFVNIQSTPGLEDGYYELVHEGVVTVLCRHRKSYNSLEVIEHTAYGVIRPLPEAYYVLINNTCTRVKNKRSLISLPGPHKAAVKRYIKENGLAFSRETLKAVALYLEKLLSRQ